MTRKKLLIIFPLELGGRYIATKNICQQLQNFKELKILTKEIKEYCRAVPKGRLRLLRNFLRNCRIIRAALREIPTKEIKNLDYIYSSCIFLLFLASLFSPLRQAKFIYHFHGFDYGEDDKTILGYIRQTNLSPFTKYLYFLPLFYFFYLIERSVLKKTWKIFVPSEYSSLVLLKRYPSIQKEKIYIIPNGYNERVFFPPKRKLKQNFCQILYVGRLVKEKGVEELIGAFKLLDNSNRRYFLTILYPSPEDFVFEKKIEKLSVRYKNITTIRGLAIDKIADLYRRSNLSILPSKTYFEQLPLAYLESLACGTPMLVSYKIPGILDWQRKVAPDLVLSKVTPREIALKIRNFCQLSAVEREQIKEHCLDFSKNFTWKNSAKLFLNHLVSK